MGDGNRHREDEYGKAQNRPVALEPVDVEQQHGELIHLSDQEEEKPEADHPRFLVAAPGLPENQRDHRQYENESPEPTGGAHADGDLAVGIGDHEDRQGQVRQLIQPQQLVDPDAEKGPQELNQDGCVDVIETVAQADSQPEVLGHQGIEPLGVDECVDARDQGHAAEPEEDRVFPSSPKQVQVMNADEEEKDAQAEGSELVAKTLQIVELGAILHPRQAAHGDRLGHRPMLLAAWRRDQDTPDPDRQQRLLPGLRRGNSECLGTRRQDAAGGAALPRQNSGQEDLVAAEPQGAGQDAQILIGPIGGRFDPTPKPDDSFVLIQSQVAPIHGDLSGFPV